jgi:hypothetical protein
MADGTLRTNAKDKKRASADLEVQVDDGDLDMLQQGTLRILRVKAKTRLDPTPGAFIELEVGGESLPIIDVTVDPKRGMGAIVTVR